MDPNNSVIKLCAEGMQAEGQGRHEDARALFTRAWDIAHDDYEACIAAHYVARQQDSPEQTLHWNQVALSHADISADVQVGDFYPSLYLNIGASYEMLGNHSEAVRYYELAAGKVDVLPDSPYGDMVRKGVSEALKRMANDTQH